MDKESVFNDFDKEQAKFEDLGEFMFATEHKEEFDKLNHRQKEDCWRELVAIHEHVDAILNRLVDWEK